MSVSWFAPVAVTLFGIIFGSFANVVIYRLPRGESLSQPGSHCPACDVPIRWYDNVPLLSWAVLKGRCRACSAPISVRYPAVELLSGALWLLAWVLFGYSWSTPFAIAFFYLLMILAMIDLDTYRLPNVLVALLAGIGGVGVAFSVLSSTRAVPLLGGGHPVVGAALGALLSSGLALAIALLYAAARKREGFGMGDVKLLAAIGLMLGVYGLLVLFVASMMGAVVGIWQAVRSREGLSAKIPFGPYLSAGAVLVTAFGPAIWSWYWGMLQ